MQHIKSNEITYKNINVLVYVNLKGNGIQNLKSELISKKRPQIKQNHKPTNHRKLIKPSPPSRVVDSPPSHAKPKGSLVKQVEQPLMQVEHPLMQVEQVKSVENLTRPVENLTRPRPIDPSTFIYRHPTYSATAHTFSYQTGLL